MVRVVCQEPTITSIQYTVQMEKEKIRNRAHQVLFVYFIYNCVTCNMGLHKRLIILVWKPLKKCSQKTTFENTFDVYWPCEWPTKAKSWAIKYIWQRWGIKKVSLFSYHFLVQIVFLSFLPLNTQLRASSLPAALLEITSVIWITSSWVVRAQSTYIYRVPQCMSPRRNWDMIPPNNQALIMLYQIRLMSRKCN